MKKLMILLAVMTMSTLALQANEPAQTVEITVSSADAAAPVKGETNETKDEVVPAS